MFLPSSFILGHGHTYECSNCVSSTNSRKSSLSLFFYLFHLRCTSPNNFQSQGLIYFHLVNLWFDPFTLEWGDFMVHFLLVNPFTLVVHLIFSISLLTLLASIDFCIRSTGPISTLTKMITAIVPSRVLFLRMRYQ